MKDNRLFIGGQWCDGTSTSEVIDKYDGTVVGVLQHASPEQVHEATRQLADAHARHVVAPYDRYEILSRAARLLEERLEDFVACVIVDSGFTHGDATREARRGIQTLLLCAEEAKRIHGEVIPIQGAPGVGRRIAFTTRHPIGVVCCITPFNSPLNTLLHKVGPAIAAGNAVIIKPASYTPATAEMAVRLLLDAGFPESLIALVHGPGSTVGEALLNDPVPAFYAFTGSTEVGTHLLRQVGLRRTQLELGSLASTIVCADADLDRAVELAMAAAFRKAGQVCTSVQRLYVEQSVYDDFVDHLTTRTSALRSGDPRLEDTTVGPLISRGDAERIESWVSSAVDLGATVATGGHRTGQVVEPTVLVDVSPQAEVMCREVFGPVVTLRSFTDLDDAIDEVNDTPFGLAAGVFTSNITTAMTVAERVRVGSVHVNETSNGRLDMMPYSGVKDSGMGREGPHYAIEEMTEERLVTIAW